jgi:16S rRNA (guanine1207-N2)-methyltransferase
MERTSELILRNAAALPAGALLLFNPPHDGLFRELVAHRRVRVVTQDFGDYEWLRQSGADARFGLLPWSSAESSIIASAESSIIPAAEPESMNHVILFLPREKERLDLLLHAIAGRLPAGGELWLAGENHAGIKSAGKRLETRFTAVAKIDSARHCGLFRAGGARPGVAFRLEDYRQQWELDLPGGALKITSLPGVFAHGRLDGGTALLLRFLAQQGERLRIAGRVLDFGCGAGVIGLALLCTHPELHLTLLDSNAAALISATWSLAANGFPSAFAPSPVIPANVLPPSPVIPANAQHSRGIQPVELLPADGLPATGPSLDWIISNPPFHRGVATDLSVARRFFERAATRLANTGRMLLVCNRHLPYEHWLGEHFAVVEKPLTDRDFKLLLAARSRR